ncbi:MAG TPA: LCP family protein [Candidatus Saccharimonadales bacterium]|nr:LCP family protein [Candidatus Saccharimonadales bacterium]
MTLPSAQYGSARGRARQTPGLGKPAGRFKRLLHKITPKRVVLTIVIIILLIGLFVAGKFIYNAHKLFGGSIFGILHSTKLKGEDQGRVNILLAGNSADDVGHNGGQLTDSIMIVSIDTRNNTAFLLSVPRDLWVDIPGAGHQKINDAYVVGQEDNFDESGYPKGGMGLLEQVIQENFGIQLDYYALVNYTALKDAVNAVGGITINVQSNDPRGLYDPSIDYATHGPLVKLSNGQHTLNGEQALDLARARGDAYGSYGFDSADFERTQNQRQMLVALKNKAATAAVVANPAKLTKLFDAVGSNVKTDFTLSEVHRLYDITKPISSSKIQSLSLDSANGKDLLSSYTTADGESALIPAAGLDDFSDIQAFVKQQTSTNPVVREDASVVVLNATDTSGLASAERTKLKIKGLNVTAIGDALSNQATTTVIDASAGKKPATRALLGQLFGNHFTTANPYAGMYNDPDFIVLVGSDQAASATTTASATTSGTTD